MSKKSVIITGAASGIAFAAAETLGTDGWVVVPVDRDEAALQAAVAALRDKGADVLDPVVADIGEESASARAVKAATADGHTLAGLINAAANNALGPVDEITADELDASYRVNVRGTFLMMSAAIPALRTGGGGAIVNVGSVDSYMGEPGTLAYCTMKGAVQNMTRAAAMDLAPSGIRVNCVCPGIIDTPFFRASFDGSPRADAILAAADARQPLGILQPDSVAETLVFLVSDRSRGMTGSTLVVDGGISVSWRNGPLA